MLKISPQLLKFIGKGQVTIPREWRIRLGMTASHVKATLQNGKIVIEALQEPNVPHWELDSIRLNQMDKGDQELIKKGREQYKNGEKDAFVSPSDFFNGNL